MKSYQRAVLSATLMAIASSDVLRESAKKKKEQQEPVKKPVVRDWLCDANKKNVGKIRCHTCKHDFKGLKRRKHCSACQPKILQERLADEQIRYNNPAPVSPYAKRDKVHG